MAQRPTGDWDIDPNTTSGTDLANILNRFQDAIDSGNSGGSRPSYLAAGGLWVQEGNPMKLYFWDGSTDTEIFNTADGIIGGMDEPTDDGDQYARQGDTVGNYSWAKVEHPEPISGGAADGTQDGIVATWDSTANSGAGQWTPDSSLTIDATGDATFSGSVSSSGTMNPSNGLKTWLWVHGNNDQIGLTLNATENRLVPYGDSKDVMDLGATTSKFKDAHFSGAVNTGWLFAGEDGANLVVGAGGGGGNFNRIQIMKPDDPTCFRANSTNANGIGADAFKVDQQGNCTAKGSIAGTFMVQDGSPVIDAKGLIKTLSTLRNATKDETTLEGLRDSIGNAIGGLIEEFEAEIAAMPAPEEPVTLPADDEPEAGTMDD